MRHEGQSWSKDKRKQPSVGRVRFSAKYITNCFNKMPILKSSELQIMKTVHDHLLVSLKVLSHWWLIRIPLIYLTNLHMRFFNCNWLKEKIQNHMDQHLHVTSIKAGIRFSDWQAYLTSCIPLVVELFK